MIIKFSLLMACFQEEGKVGGRGCRGRETGRDREREEGDKGREEGERQREGEKRETEEIGFLTN